MPRVRRGERSSPCEVNEKSSLPGYVLLGGVSNAALPARRVSHRNCTLPHRLNSILCHTHTLTHTHTHTQSVVEVCNLITVLREGWPRAPATRFTHGILGRRAEAQTDDEAPADIYPFDTTHSVSLSLPSPLSTSPLFFTFYLPFALYI